VLPVRPIRTLLFVPGSRPDMMAKAAASDADAVCFDLEDSVVPGQKAAARGNVARALRDLDFGRRVRVVRVNGLDSPYTYRDLVDVIETAGDRVDVVMLPKTGSPRDVVFVEMLLTQIEAAHGRAAPIGIDAQIETAAGFLYAREIAAASPRLEGLIFGPGDFAASMQMPAAAIGEPDAHDTGYPGHRWHAVMQTIVAAARTNGLRCMDGPYAAYRDGAGLARACAVARALGFDGKQCIHPAQLAAVNTAFAPTAAEVAHAAALLAAVERATAAGQGAATHDGRMIDAASLRMARVVLERHRMSQG
jgi:citrate lyase subunit beta/citryl-CoA lyase